MTAPARITQADMERAVKSVKAGGFDKARVVMDLEKNRIEVILGDEPAPEATQVNEWDRE